MENKTIQVERYNSDNIFLAGVYSDGEIAFADFLKTDVNWEGKMQHFDESLKRSGLYCNMCDILNDIKDSPIGTWKVYVSLGDGSWKETARGMKNIGVRVICKLQNIHGNAAIHFLGVKGEEPPQYDSEDNVSEIDGMDEESGKAALIKDLAGNGFSRNVAETVFAAIKDIEGEEGDSKTLIIEDFNKTVALEAQKFAAGKPRTKDLWLNHRVIFKMNTSTAKLYHLDK